MLPRSVSIGLAASLLALVSFASAANRPNVLLIVADDVGYAEFGFQGSKDTPTPHIDSIAQHGIRFTQGYVSGPYCSPSRAGLMTGRYQTRFGHEFNSVAREAGLAPTERTMAERYKAAGYGTCLVGKWHLGEKPQYRPTNHGFDEFYGTLANTASYNPARFVDSRISSDVQEINDDEFYTTEAFGQRAVDWLDKHDQKPWFLYLAFNAQHAPLEAPERYLERFAHIEDEQRRTFAAMMAVMDDAVGNVLKKVRQLGQEENTLVFFLSDNGGPTDITGSRNHPLRGFKSTTWEGGIRIPFCMQWRGTLPEGVTYDHPIIQLDILPTCLAASGLEVTSADHLDGVNLLPFLKAEDPARPHQALYWRYGNQWAVRHGDWKLVLGRDGGPAPRLFELSTDIGETNDLAQREPEKVAELQKLWNAWNSEQIPSTVPQEIKRRPNRQANPRRTAAT